MQVCHITTKWWRHAMEKVTGNPPVTGGFPKQGARTRAFDVSFDVSLNKRLKSTVELTVILNAIRLLVTSL